VASLSFSDILNDLRSIPIIILSLANSKSSLSASGLNLSTKKVCLLSFMNSFCYGSIYKIFYFCSCKTWCHLGEIFRQYCIIAANFVQIQLENVLATIHIRMGNMNFFVKPPWSCCSWIKGVLMVSCAYYHNILVLFKTIHFS